MTFYIIPKCIIISKHRIIIGPSQPAHDTVSIVSELSLLTFYKDKNKNQRCFYFRFHSITFIVQDKISVPDTGRAVGISEVTPQAVSFLGLCPVLCSWIAIG